MYGIWILALAVSWTFSSGVYAQDVASAPAAQPLGSEDVVPGLPFQEGDVLTFDQLDKLKDYILILVTQLIIIRI